MKNYYEFVKLILDSSKLNRRLKSRFKYPQNKQWDRLPKKSQNSQLGLVRLIPSLIILSLFASAVFILAWVGWLTWYDMTEWNNDIGSIFFGVRTGEAISLGIGMRIIYYFVMGMSLLALALFLFLRKRIGTTKPRHVTPIQPQKVNAKKMEVNLTVKSLGKGENAAEPKERFSPECLHHFGYLASRPKDSPIPQECFICQRLGDCMVATGNWCVKKAGEWWETESIRHQMPQPYLRFYSDDSSCLTLQIFAVAPNG